MRLQTVVDHAPRETDTSADERRSGERKFSAERRSSEQHTAKPEPVPAESVARWIPTSASTVRVAESRYVHCQLVYEQESEFGRAGCHAISTKVCLVFCNCWLLSYA